jgi:RNA polymerase sigma-70 factor (TIGR02960 family)
MDAVIDPTLSRARSGDPNAFKGLVDPYRRELHMHCYWILGSFEDAEDALQDTLLSAWQAFERLEGDVSIRAWLYRIATNRCLNYLRTASRRPQVAEMPQSWSLSSDTTTSDEPWWLESCHSVLIDEITLGPEAFCDARESIAISFVAGLQRLPTHQRTALLLRDVLGFSAAEAAEILKSTPASINSALQRARLRFESTEDPNLVPLPRSGHDALVVDRFVDTFQRGDLNGLISLLTDDDTL